MKGAVVDNGPVPFEVCARSAEKVWVMQPRWRAFAGISTWNYLLDVRNVSVGTGSVLSVSPVLQLAKTRTDRPEEPEVVTGDALTAAGLRAYAYSPGGVGNKLYYRVGAVAWLSTVGQAPFGWAQGLVYSSARDLGVVHPAVELDFQPWNDKNLVSWFPLVQAPIPAAGVDKGKLVVHGFGNATTTMGWQLAGRAFNDPLARGSFVLLEGDQGWRVPSTENFAENTGELSLSALNLGSTNYFFEPALAVRKTADNDTNSRCSFNVLFALKLA